MAPAYQWVKGAWQQNAGGWRELSWTSRVWRNATAVRSLAFNSLASPFNHFRSLCFYSRTL